MVDIDLIGLPTFVVSVGRSDELRFVSFNAANEAASGLRAQDIIGRPFEMCLPAKVARRVTAQCRECIATRAVHAYDEPFERGGRIAWWRTTLSPVIDPASGRVVRIVGVSVDITEHKRIEEELVHAAFRDPLTGVSNRRSLENDIENAMSETAYTNRTFALIVIDLDGFKAVNDTFGHRKGDDVLRHVASLLSLTTRPNETVARIGGDEFAMLVRAGSGTELVSKVTMLRHYLDRSMSVSDVETTLGVSVGAALWQPTQSFEDLLAVADLDMYNDKNRRKALAA